MIVEAETWSTSLDRLLPALSQFLDKEAGHRGRMPNPGSCDAGMSPGSGGKLIC